MAKATSAPDLTGRGTPESAWSRCSTLAALPSWPLPLPAGGRIMVVAPHPDDEILGAGGTTARLCRLGAGVDLVAVTDGEHSHPGFDRYLRIVRPLETLAAAGRLGIDFGSISRLRHPDGQVDETKLVGQLTARIRPGDVVLAPWSSDGHPDHDAVGRAAETACARAGADLVAYLVWAWHWASPEDLPWEKALRVDLDDLAAAKRGAAAA
ncbi:MAG: PIG-L family deacetylase, partial [Acidimicrobiales bacterium]|nr:PIG-L family deacetylase [Acidimicrobiales bacterium]